MTLNPELFAQGGLVAFSAGTNIRKSGLTGAVLSFLIKKLTHSGITHSALVPPKQCWLDQTPWIIESTEWNGISGPQYNLLAPRLQKDYLDQGGSAQFYPFLPSFTPDWDAVLAAAHQMFVAVGEGKLHYSVARLFADATARNLVFACLPVAGIINWMAEKDEGMVCSECVGLLLTAGGLETSAKAAGVPWLAQVEPIPGQPIGCSPQDLIDMPLWGSPVSIP